MRSKAINRVTLLLLLIGFGCAGAVFLTVAPATEDPLLGDYRSSKRYQRELKMMGGEANVLADDFQEWFGNQWHGRELVRTIIILTIGVTLFYRLIASHPDHADETGGENSNESK